MFAGFVDGGKAAAAAAAVDTEPPAAPGPEAPFRESPV